MKCKNCQDILRTDFSYCPSCGAKVVERRLTFKGLFNDIVERIFNLENNVFKTIGHMTLWPERVINSYVDGTRRKYLNPLNYLTLSIALSGVLFYFMKKFALDNMDFDVFGMGVNQEGQAKLMEAIMEYSSFIFILYIPIIALAGILSFNKREYNIPEYIVAATYSLSHFSVLTFPVSLLVILVIPESYMSFSLFYLFLMVAYFLFTLIRIHKYSFGMTIVRIFLFCILFFIGYMALSIAMPFLLILTGDLTLQDLLPPKA
ncbi:DUF3667 domain-containing protein [Flavobacteriaceae bacterium D16]|nr:DUF3667 domain-containing protein [Flavobacteriaceae bacterium D16]